MFKFHTFCKSERTHWSYAIFLVFTQLILFTTTDLYNEILYLAPSWITKNTMVNNLGVFGLLTNKYRRCFTNEIRGHCQMMAQKILHLKCCNFAKRDSTEMGAKLCTFWRLLKKTNFPHGCAAIYMGGIQSMGSRNINMCSQLTKFALIFFWNVTQKWCLSFWKIMV